MALIKCQECNELVSDQAFMCPKCGHPKKTIPVAGFFHFGYQWKSKTEFAGIPLVHIAFGFDKKTGKLLVAKGIIAIGQFAMGIITVAQFGIGVLFGLGQFITGYFAVGQFALGYIVVAQLGIGAYVLCQAGLGKYIWSVARKDQIAIEFFKNFGRLIGQ
jgi:hypothetical protein